MSGQEAVYTAVGFSKAKPTAAELAAVNWLIESDGAEVARYLAHGPELRYVPPGALAGKRLHVMPYRVSPSRNISVVTNVDGLASPTHSGAGAMTFAIEREGAKIYARADGGARFYVASIVRYGQGRGLMNTADGAGPIFDPADYRERFGFWADFIAPTARCESGGCFHRINTYDRARFTFGLLQHAAHTANANFALLFRRLLMLPAATAYFPDLKLDGGRICWDTGRGTVPLEVGDPPLPFLDYLNPSLDAVEDAEALNAAKFIHWCIHDPTHRDTQVAFAIEDTKRKMGDYARRYGLSGANADICLAVCDIRHQGRARSTDILNALGAADSLDRLLRLGADSYAERIETLRGALDQAGFSAWKYDEPSGDFVERA
ncbi:MAG: hypothetical protein AB7M05_14495 [Alphaproteobacteria bacterium]